MLADSTYPAYVELLRTGELHRRAQTALDSLRSCHLCPRHCEANRQENELGTCGIGCSVSVASYGAHHGEEDCLRGWRGSGTIFFSGCNLLCVFCQNWDISHDREGAAVSTERLADIMLELQAQGCHNINWVTPTHIVPQALAALAIAAERGLRLPIVYNTGGYDSVETLRWLDGVVDIYMPDFKFWGPDAAERLAQARDYPAVARTAIREMHRQVGVLQVDGNGLARRGVLVRHLVMPNDLAGTGEIARWLAGELSPDTYINVMAQYHPDGDDLRHDDIARPTTAAEFRAAMRATRQAGLHRFDERQPRLN